MSKEELLKYLIAEIDLIMHDKDYRFENQNGTWYSRKSCRDLTNEEVFEELKGELRQLADLEAKLAEKEKEVEELKQRLKDTIKIYSDNFVEKDKELKELRFQARNIFPLVENLEDKVNQDKISFAVEQLEKVKEEFDCCYSGDTYSPYQIADKIDNQIAELKKEMK